MGPRGGESTPGHSLPRAEGGALHSISTQERKERTEDLRDSAFALPLEREKRGPGSGPKVLIYL